MIHLLSSRRRRLCVIFVVFTIAGILNGVIIFNLTHQFGYATEVIPAILAMSGDNKNVVVDNEQDYQKFLSYTKEYSNSYTIYMMNNLPDDIDRVWFILSSDNPKKSEEPNNLLSGFRVVSEIINDNYSAFELEKL